MKIGSGAAATMRGASPPSDEGGRERGDVPADAAPPRATPSVPRDATAVALLQVGSALERMADSQDRIAAALEALQALAASDVETMVGGAAPTSRAAHAGTREDMGGDDAGAASVGNGDLDMRELLRKLDSGEEIGG